MQNKYAKQCAKCNVTVPAYEGVCEKVGNAWVVEHVECHTPSTATRSKLAEIQAKSRALREPPTDHPAIIPMDAFDWMEQDF
jgi:hypothetical protein